MRTLGERRAVISVVFAVLAWSVQDILLWQRIFEANGLFQYDPIYQYWHSAFLTLLLIFGVIWLRRGWAAWFAIATWTLANSGLADVLYYWLDGRPIPATLPWLDTLHPLIFFHPATSTSVVASSLVWVGFWTLTLLARRLVGLMTWAALYRVDRVAPAGG